MKTAVIGCGNISRCHFNTIKKTEGVEIAAVCDIKEDRAKNASHLYGGEVYTDYIKMLDEVKPDCVHICTPHYLHGEMASQALKKNINVLCEKPCAMNKEGLLLIEEALKECRAQFGVCFQNRYNESILTVKAVLDSGEYGDIVCVRASVHWKRELKYYSDDWHGTKAKEGGGVLINQSIHTLDLMRYIIGEDMKYVTGHALNEKFSEIEVEDTVSARFETESGKIAYFNATIGAGIDHPIMIDIVCEKATIRIEGNSAYKIQGGEYEKLYFSKENAFIGKNYWGNGHEALISDFYDCIKSGRHFPIDFSEGRKSVEEFSAVYASSAKGKQMRIR